MDENKQNNPMDPWDRDSYETGSTRPPKNRGGLIALLLGAVIFLGGIASALGLLNIRLSLRFADTPDRTLSFSRSDAGEALSDMPESGEQTVMLEGIACQNLSILCQEMYQLPEGLYVAYVEQGSHAEALGIAQGDVLLSLGGTPVSQLDALQDLLSRQAAGAQVEIVTYRGGQENRLTLTLDD